MNSPNAPQPSQQTKPTEATPDACCSATDQATCCEPSAKAGCCGPQATSPTAKAPSSCGCR